MTRRRPRRKGGSLRDGERRQLALASRRAERPPAPGDRARLLCDGGSRGNPGPAAIAAVQRDPPADPALAALTQEIRVKARGFSTVRWTWHPRGENEAADALVRDLLWR